MRRSLVSANQEVEGPARVWSISTFDALIEARSRKDHLQREPAVPRGAMRKISTFWRVEQVIWWQNFYRNFVRAERERSRVMSPVWITQYFQAGERKMEDWYIYLISTVNSVCFAFKQSRSVGVILNKLKWYLSTSSSSSPWWSLSLTCNQWTRCMALPKLFRFSFSKWWQERQVWVPPVCCACLLGVMARISIDRSIGI